MDVMAWSSRAIQGEAADRLFRARRRRILVLNMCRLRRYRNDKRRHMENSLVLGHSRGCVDIALVRQVGNDRATLGTAFSEWIVKGM